MQPSIAGGKPNILADIKRDHAQFFSLYRQYKETSADEEKQTLVWQLIHDLTVHSLAEEEVLYPEMTKHMGTKCRDHALSEHKTLKDILSDIDAMTVASPGFNDKLKMLMVALEHHIKEEEDEMLVEFARLVGRDDLAQLAGKFQKAKLHVPTRPHAWAPDKPSTGNIITNTLTAPLDKLRDAVRHGMGPAHNNAPAGQS
ncbi:hypothetical protein COO60DRAFT_1699953 [Scenedesmus sp. NREL 46B-D3]|nr:hypothetical protein COO60DRAFT_1699953 [Scenedesmus sp. NREL 46B-D3]